MTGPELSPQRVIRSKRRSMALEIRQDGEIWLRIPLQASLRDARDFVAQHQAWLAEGLRKLRHAPRPRPLTEEDIRALQQRARGVLPAKLAAAAKLLGVEPKGLRITSAQKRFGSCSAKGRICFSYLLMRYPERAIDYVVLHEAAHLKHLNHGKAFYALIGQHMPDYKQRQALLKQAPTD